MSSYIVYTSIPQVLSSCKSLKEQLDLIDVILVGMLSAIVNATATGEFDEYKLDTGQTKNEVRYRSLSDLQDAYQKMFQTKQLVLAQMNYGRTGRIFRLVDGKNFIGNKIFFTK